MNYSDSERVAAILEKIGYQKAQIPEDSDLYIFNTCSIRQKGEDRVYGYLKVVSQWKKKNPRLLIGITGCMVRKTSSRNTPKDLKMNY
jgi:tRNA-2-methylthio-N6-dimethylallyladenosine synthase